MKQINTSWRTKHRDKLNKIDIKYICKRDVLTACENVVITVLILCSLIHFMYIIFVCRSILFLWVCVCLFS